MLEQPRKEASPIKEKREKKPRVRLIRKHLKSELKRFIDKKNARKNRFVNLMQRGQRLDLL